MKEIFSSALNALTKGESVVLCSVIASSGSTPRGAGAKMLVLKDGRSIGTIGGGAVEYETVRLAKDMHYKKESYVKSFNLSDKQKADLGMVCGGNATVYFQFIPAEDEIAIKIVKRAISMCDGHNDAWLITSLKSGQEWGMGVYSCVEQFVSHNVEKSEIERHISSKATVVNDKYYVEPLLMGGFCYIFGGGHVAQALVPVIAKVKFRPVVFDDRERFTDASLFPGAYNAILGDFSHISSKLKITKEDYVIIVTRGHEADYTVLEQTIKTPARYIGMIGSKHKIAHTHEKLKEAGVNEEDIKKIHNPIGINIRAETPDEIAISIAAELILSRANASGFRG